MSAAVQELELQNMEAETVDDLALAQRVAETGDEEALQALYDHYADPLFAFIFHHLDGARQEAEEVWQDTLSAALRSLRSFQGQSRFFSWLCGIARHKIADHCRSRGRVAQHLVLLPPEDLTRLMDAGPLPDEIVNDRATRLRVVAALGQLPTDYQQALVARYADGRNVQEIAQLLGKSYKAAESVLSRAREALATALVTEKETDL